MAHKRFFRQAFTLLALALVIALTFLVCSNPDGSDLTAKSLSEKYAGVKGNTACELTITQSTANAQAKANVFTRAAFTPAEGDSYLLKIIENGVTQTSNGIVKAFSNNKFTLAPTINVSVSFEVTVNNSGITNISGTIIIQSGATIPGPGELTPGGGNPGGFASGNPGGTTGNPGGFASGNPGGTTGNPGGTTGNPGGGNTGTPVAVTGVSLDKTSLTFANGESYPLTATVSPSNATNQNVSWKSSNPDVVILLFRNPSVQDVIAVSAGTATITVTTEDGNKTATCDVTVKDLNAPTGFSATATWYDSITLSWSPVTDADGYRIRYYIPSGSGFLEDLKCATTSYTFTGLRADTRYCFVVSAYIGEGERPGVGTASSFYATTKKLNAPSGVSATATSSSIITVSWSPVSDATEYSIWYFIKTKDGTNFGKRISGIKSTSYIFTDLLADTTYGFEVRSHYNSTSSDSSSAVSATTLP
jgi:hypothetical protein